MLRTIRIAALASFFEGLAAFIWLISIPTSGGTFSPIRLASLSGILLVSLGCLAGFFFARTGSGFAKRIGQIAGHRAGLPAAWLLMTISLAVWVTILHKDWLLSFVEEAVYTRSLPLVTFGALLCLQAGILFLIPHLRMGTRADIFGPIWKPTLILLGCFLAIWGFMSLTHLGFIFDNVGLSWGPPGTPISFPQVILVLAVSVALASAYEIFGSKITIPRFRVSDIVIFLGLWGLAVILWWGEPVSPTHFNPPPMAPNHETYPNSDALIFDRSAYHLLSGTGFSNQLVRRPLYVGMLAFFHALGGLDYEGTIFMQILLLAFIPPLTYLLTSKLSNRLAGLMAGGLILLRERNAIELSDRIMTANAKLMMSDMIAMLGIIAFLYAVTRMLSTKDRSIWSSMIAGACLGLTALVRAQALILLPPLLLFILLEKSPLKIRMKDALLVVLGFVLVMSPWVWRNWNLTGTFVLDDRGEEKLLARNYSLNPVAFPPTLPGETEKEYSARIKREMLAFIIEHPSEVALFTSNHFLRNLATGTVYIAPSISDDLPRDLVERTYFWDEWRGMLVGNNGISIFATLIFLALGIALAQAKNKPAGWFPIVAFLFYSAGNALVRTSGWRFSLPVDWVILVYYSIGLAYLPSRVRLVPDENVPVEAVIGKSSKLQRSFAGPIVLFLLLLAGASVPIAERLIPARDFSYLSDIARERLSFENVVSSSEIDAFLQQENAVFYSGMALYPRHITSNSRVYLAYTPPREFKFLHFWLINDSDNQIIFPAGTSPEVFLHTSKVSILGCKADNYIMAWAVVLHSAPEQVFIQDASLELKCPMNVTK